MPDDLVAIRVLFEQLHVLRAQVEALDPTGVDKRGAPGSGVSVLIPKFNKFLQRAKQLLRDHQSLLDAIDVVDPVYEIEERLASSYHQKAKQEVLFGTNALLQALAPLLLPTTAGALSVDREGVFAAGQQFDALQAASKILRQATQRIVLIDGYMSHNVLSLLAGKDPSVAVHVLAKAHGVRPDIKPLAEAFNKQFGAGGQLEIRTSDAFHDRYIFIDDKDYYHFGASLKDLGGRGFMFSRIEEPSVIAAVKKQFDDEWSRAPVVV
jgi:hypothetical protein